MNTFTKGAAAALIVATMAGCGTQGLAGSTAKVPDATFEALSASGLKKAFTRVHKAIFNAMDADKNKWLDEYEVGKHMTMSEFRKADRADGWGSAGRLSQTEFVDYATSTFLWFNQDKDSFANSFRQALAKAFNRLDSNDDGLLKKTANVGALESLAVEQDGPALTLRVRVRERELCVYADKRTKIRPLGDTRERRLGKLGGGGLVAAERVTHFDGGGFGRWHDSSVGSSADFARSRPAFVAPPTRCNIDATGGSIHLVANCSH